jgi:hypothetical protein
MRGGKSSDSTPALLGNTGPQVYSCGMSRRSDISVLGGAVAVALLTAPVAAAPKPIDSWGKAGVDLETYRNDSLECGLLGYYADVSQTEQAQAFVRATRQMEGADNTNYAAPSASAAQAMDMTIVQARQYEQIRRSIRPERRISELKTGMEAVVQDCLRERGYVQFRLTDEQREALADLRNGSDERRAFLHGLASDPAVLDSQKLPVARS